MSKILFFGELAPNIVHGISLANRLNIDLLSDCFNVDVKEEKSDFKEYGKRNSSKIKKILFNAKEIFTQNKVNKYDYFYIIFSFSTFGSLKTFLAILSFVLSSSGSVVVHIHRGDFGVFYNENILNRLITKVIFRLTNKLVVLSHNQKGHFKNFLKEENIYVLENSLNQEYNFEDKKVGRKKILYISNYIKEKGIFDLLEALKSLPSISLECFGGFVNNEKEIKSYKSETIKINGFIYTEKYQKIYESDALILPSWNEGQPTIILEAMMVGTIILTTKVGLIGELLGDDYPFYFEAQNVESLKECICRFDIYEFKDELSVKLKKMYFDNYSKKVHQEKLLKIFGE